MVFGKSIVTGSIEGRHKLFVSKNLFSLGLDGRCSTDEAWNASHVYMYIDWSLFMRGVCLMVVAVRHISHGDAFRARGLANVVLFVLIQNNALQSPGLIYGYEKS